MSGLSLTDPDFKYLVVDRKALLKEQKGVFDGKKSCWVPHVDEGFVKGEIQSADGDNVTVKTEDNQTKVCKKDAIQQMNPPKYEMIDDMANMTYLNEACVLANLRARYEKFLIYTYSGLFCIAVNPYRRDLGLYSQKVIDAYKGRRPTEMPPHLFMVAEKAYQYMLQDRENQSCLITGESGAGKTENTKKVIMYLAKIAAAAVDDGKASLEDQIIQCNPVMEAYGNATTTRNNNSSRFGKFIRIHFGTSGKIAGADIEHYLLEKSRVTYCQKAERNYHIFYQLLCPTGIPELAKLVLCEPDVGLYTFANQGKLVTDGIDDAQECKDCDEAFGVLGFSNEEKESLYKCTGSILHMGEMKFKSRGEQAEADGSEEAEKVAFLLGVNAGDLLKALLKPKIKVGTEWVTKGQNLNQVTYSVSALAKSLYERFFNWLVKRCNKTLDTNNKRQSYIGVLDIAGFEIFDFNTFEQLCINYTNERLQQFFNHNMFVLEQEEYKKEGIEWEFINFGMDLQASIDLIEKPMGLLSTLEEQCMFPKATDKSLQDALNQTHLGKSKAYGKAGKSKGNQGQADFELYHYAGVVRYSTVAWLEKNKDPLNQTVANLLAESKEALVGVLFEIPPEPAAGGKKKKSAAFQTISSVHKESLTKLMKSLYATHPHFVRCIIPNEKKQPGLTDSPLVMHQLQCNGVLEGIRICRKGFPSRIVYPEFKQRYSICAPNAIPEGFVDGKKVTGNILEALQLDAAEYKLGNTKVFFKAGVLGTLEEMRDERLGKIIAMFQAHIRGSINRSKFATLKAQRTGLELIQKNIRSWLGLKNWSWWRMYVKIKPLLNAAASEDEMKQKEEELKKIAEEAVKTQQLAKDLQEQNNMLSNKSADLVIAAQAAEENLEEAKLEIEELIQQKIEVAANTKELEDKVAAADEAIANAEAKGGKMSAENKTLHEDLDTLEATLAAADKDKAAMGNKIKAMENEAALLGESGAKLATDKKALEDKVAATEDALKAESDKCSNLNKLKSKLEAALDELEEGLAHEKKVRADLEKSKKKVEGDLKASQEVAANLDSDKTSLEGLVKRKDADIAGLNTKVADGDSLAASLSKKIKELNARIEEIEEELDQEQQAKAKAEKQRSELAGECDDLASKLEEAGGSASAQAAQNKKLEGEISQLRSELVEAGVAGDAALSSLKKKNQEALNEMEEEMEALQKVKSKLDKEKKKLKAEVDDALTAVEHAKKNKGMSGDTKKKVDNMIADLTNRLEMSDRENTELQTTRARAGVQIADLGTHLEEAEHRASKNLKERKACEAALEEANDQLETETRGCQKARGECRGLIQDLDNAKAALEDEEERRAECERRLYAAERRAKELAFQMH